MGTDQAHEQNNKFIKADGGAMVHTSYPEFSTKILGEYCEVQVAKKIKALANVLG